MSLGAAVGGAGIGIGTSVAATSLNSQAALQSSSAQSSQYLYQAGIAEMNRRTALENRDYALTVGESEALAFGLKAGQRKGEIRAAQGASGIDVGSGSSKDVRVSQEQLDRLDADTIRRNAARVAYGHSIEAAREEAQTELYRRASKDTIEGGKIKARASLISGASSVADKFMQIGQFGLGAARSKSSG